MSRWKFKKVEGKVIERDIGEAVVECLGERATPIIVFAEDEGAGGAVHTRHGGLRLEVDPATGQLRKVKALSAPTP